MTVNHGLGRRFQKFRDHVDQSGLQQVQGQHRDLLALPVGAGQVPVLAVEQVVVGGVPVLHHLQALVDLPPQLRVGQVVADERRPRRPAKLFDRPVGRVFRAAAGEASQHLVGLRRAMWRDRFLW